jgi:gamma-F420-2:alpha-L-glutamate ligase
MKKNKIWILEKKADFNSFTEKRLFQIAGKMNIELKFVSPEEISLIVNNKNKRSIIYNGDTVDLPDCAIARTDIDTYHSLAVIRQLERLGVPVLNSSQSIEISKDKLSTIQLLSANNIPVPKTILARFPFSISLAEKELSYPIVVKTVMGSSGRGVFLVENRNKLNDIVNLIEISKDPKTNLILQEFIGTSNGKDIRVVTIGGKAAGAVLRKAVNGSFKANYTAGGRVVPYAINSTIEYLAVKSAEIAGLEIAGVDILFDKDNYRVCELNSYPGFEGFETATGIDVTEKIFQYILRRPGNSSINI